jgi:hypothetical protein
VQIALRLRAFGGPENFELTDVPKQAIRPGMALIRVDAELASDTLAERWGKAARLPGFRPRADKFPLALISPSSANRRLIDPARPRRQS